MKTITLAVTAATLAIAAPAAAQVPGPPAGGADPRAVAEQACGQLEAKLGAEQFERSLGGMDGCITKLEPAIRAGMKACRDAASPGSQEFKACMQARVQAAVKQHAGTGGDAAKAAKTICANIRKKLGAEKFEGRFGDLDACAQEFEPAAKSALARCAKASEPGSDAFKSCMRGRIKEKIAATGTTKAADRLAAKACAQLRERLGEARFDERFGSLAGCLSKMVARAQKALAACAKKSEPGSRAHQTCIRSAMKEGKGR